MYNIWRKLQSESQMLMNMVLRFGTVGMYVELCVSKIWSEPQCDNIWRKSQSESQMLMNTGRQVGTKGVYVELCVSNI